MDRGARVIEDGLKLTAYFGERKRRGEKFVADALLDLYGRHQVASSILLRGIEGFGLKHHLRSDSSLSLSEDLPAVAIAVDARSRIEALLDEVGEVCGEGLITLERARLHAGQLRPLRPADQPQEATKLTVYLGRQDRIDRVPAFAAVCQLLRRQGVDGASTLLGVDGTAHGDRKRASFFGRNVDVPVMVVAVGSGDRIADALPELAAVLRRPLITSEQVQVCKRDGEVLQSPHELPGTDEHGLALWQKLTVYTSESALHGGQPVHRAITRRLRSCGAAGATTVRGVWGFSGSEAPHGDRTFQYGRRVPAVTSVIDTPGRIAECFAVIDELTVDHGLVTSEVVPAMRARAELRTGRPAGPGAPHL